MRIENHSTGKWYGTVPAVGIPVQAGHNTIIHRLYLIYRRFCLLYGVQGIYDGKIRAKSRKNRIPYLLE